MKTTTNYGFDKPESSDSPDGASQIASVVDDLDAIAWLSRSVKLDAGIKAASEGLTLTETTQDVPGAKLEITPAVSSKLLVIPIFEVTGSAALSFAGTVKLDAAADEANAARLANTTIGTTTQVYVLSLSAGAHTVKLRAKRTNAEAATVSAPGTRFFHALFAA